MRTQLIPFIAQKYYQAIRSLVSDLPETYLEWLRLYAGEQDRLAGNIKEVPVRPDEFAAYCEGLAIRNARFEDLLRFVEELTASVDMSNERDIRKHTG